MPTYTHLFGIMLGLWLWISSAYAGNVSSFPKSYDMQRQMGELKLEEKTETALDSFYLYKQKSLEREKTNEDQKDIQAEVEPDNSGMPVTASEKHHPEEIESTPVVHEEETRVSEASQEPTLQQTAIDQDTYLLGPGDILEISAWKDEALSKVIPILPDGTIHFPLLGQIRAGGNTVAVLRDEIERKLSRYVPEPFVDISVKQVNSMMVYVIGKVNQPGRFLLNGNINVLQALSMAGGLNTFAKGKKIKIIRNDGGESHLLTFNYDEVVSGDDLSQNIRLQRGDIIVAP